MTIPPFPGWHLLGAFPNQAPNDVGSWLLVHHGEALLLEIPPGLTTAIVQSALYQLGARLKYATVSHTHYDHFHASTWRSLPKTFHATEFLHPSTIRGDCQVWLGGEPVWLIESPKHSANDIVTVFRGVAMTGDIELGTLDSVNNAVPLRTKRSSMKWLSEFGNRTGYRVHSIVSAHLNDVRVGINWPELFAVR